MTQEPEPLKFKLHELPTPDNTWIKPLGTLQALPFYVIPFIFKVIFRLKEHIMGTCQCTQIIE